MNKNYTFKKLNKVFRTGGFLTKRLVIFLDLSLAVENV